MTFGPGVHVRVPPDTLLYVHRGSAAAYIWYVYACMTYVRMHEDDVSCAEDTFVHVHRGSAAAYIWYVYACVTYVHMYEDDVKCLEYMYIEAVLWPISGMSMCKCLHV
jgi:hypothetical protein